jgi:hypothetical protein
MYGNRYVLQDLQPTILLLKYVMINSKSIKKKNANSMQCLLYETNFCHFMTSGSKIYTKLSYCHNELKS